MEGGGGRLLIVEGKKGEEVLRRRAVEWKRAWPTRGRVVFKFKSAKACAAGLAAVQAAQRQGRGRVWTGPQYLEMRSEEQHVAHVHGQDDGVEEVGEEHVDERVVACSEVLRQLCEIQHEDDDSGSDAGAGCDQQESGTAGAGCGRQESESGCGQQESESGCGQQDSEVSGRVPLRLRDVRAVIPNARAHEAAVQFVTRGVLSRRHLRCLHRLLFDGVATEAARRRLQPHAPVSNFVHVVTVEVKLHGDERLADAAVAAGLIAGTELPVDKWVTQEPAARRAGALAFMDFDKRQLYYAVRYGMHHVVVATLEEWADKAPWRKLAVSAAASHGYIATLRLLQGRLAPSDCRVAVVNAIKQGQLQVLQWLLGSTAAGAAQEHVRPDESMLIAAVKAGHVDILLYLLHDRGVVPGLRVVKAAVQARRCDMVRAVVPLVARMSTPQAAARALLFLADMYDSDDHGKSCAVATCLLTDLAADATADCTRTALCKAAEHGTWELVHALLAAGAPANSFDGHILGCAAEARNVTVARSLLQTHAAELRPYVPRALQQCVQAAGDEPAMGMLELLLEEAAGGVVVDDLLVLAAEVHCWRAAQYLMTRPEATVDPVAERLLLAAVRDRQSDMVASVLPHVPPDSPHAAEALEAVCWGSHGSAVQAAATLRQLMPLCKHTVLHDQAAVTHGIKSAAMCEHWDVMAMLVPYATDVSASEWSSAFVAGHAPAVAALVAAANAGTIASHATAAAAAALHAQQDGSQVPLPAVAALVLEARRASTNSVTLQAGAWLQLCVDTDDGQLIRAFLQLPSVAPSAVGQAMCRGAARRSFTSLRTVLEDAVCPAPCALVLKALRIATRRALASRSTEAPAALLAYARRHGYLCEPPGTDFVVWAKKSAVAAVDAVSCEVLRFVLEADIVRADFHHGALIKVAAQRQSAAIAATLVTFPGVTDVATTLWRQLFTAPPWCLPTEARFVTSFLCQNFHPDTSVVTHAMLKRYIEQSFSVGALVKLAAHRLPDCSFDDLFLHAIRHGKRIVATALADHVDLHIVQAALGVPNAAVLTVKDIVRQHTPRFTPGLRLQAALAAAAAGSDRTHASPSVSGTRDVDTPRRQRATRGRSRRGRGGRRARVSTPRRAGNRRRHGRTAGGLASGPSDDAAPSTHRKRRRANRRGARPAAKRARRQ